MSVSRDVGNQEDCAERDELEPVHRAVDMRLGVLRHYSAAR